MRKGPAVRIKITCSGCEYLRCSGVSFYCASDNGVIGIPDNLDTPIGCPMIEQDHIPLVLDSLHIE